MANRPVFGARPPSYVSKATLAAELDISESTVDEWVRRGILPKPFRAGGSVRWHWPSVEAALGALGGQGQPSDNDPFMAGVKNVSSAP